MKELYKKWDFSIIVFCKKFSSKFSLSFFFVFLFCFVKNDPLSALKSENKCYPCQEKLFYFLKESHTLWYTLFDTGWYNML